MDEGQARTSLKETWDFHYKVVRLLAAAKAKVVHHRSRYKWWSEQKKDAEEKLKRKGFEYRRQYRSMGEDLVVVGDPQMVARMKECQESMERHTEKISDYESWVRALEGKAKAEPDGELTLKIEDVMFFGL